MFDNYYKLVMVTCLLPAFVLIVPSMIVVAWETFKGKH